MSSANRMSSLACETSLELTDEPSKQYLFFYFLHSYSIDGAKYYFLETVTVTLTLTLNLTLNLTLTLTLTQTLTLMECLKFDNNARSIKIC